jgi:hypothetical protein
MVPQQRIELRFDAYKATVIPIYYKGKNNRMQFLFPIKVEFEFAVLHPKTGGG